MKNIISEDSRAGSRTQITDSSDANKNEHNNNMNSVEAAIEIAGQSIVHDPCLWKELRIRLKSSSYSTHAGVNHITQKFINDNEQLKKQQEQIRIKQQRQLEEEEEQKEKSATFRRQNLNYFFRTEFSVSDPSLLLSSTNTTAATTIGHTFSKSNNKNSSKKQMGSSTHHDDNNKSTSNNNSSNKRNSFRRSTSDGDFTKTLFSTTTTTKSSSSCNIHPEEEANYVLKRLYNDKVQDNLAPACVLKEQQHNKTIDAELYIIQQEYQMIRQQMTRRKWSIHAERCFDAMLEALEIVKITEEEDCESSKEQEHDILGNYNSINDIESFTSGNDKKMIIIGNEDNKDEDNENDEDDDNELLVGFPSSRCCNTEEEEDEEEDDDDDDDEGVSFHNVHVPVPFNNGSSKDEQIQDDEQEGVNDTNNGTVSDVDKLLVSFPSTRRRRPRNRSSCMTMTEEDKTSDNEYESSSDSSDSGIEEPQHQQQQEEWRNNNNNNNNNKNASRRRRTKLLQLAQSQQKILVEHSRRSSLHGLMDEVCFQLRRNNHNKNNNSEKIMPTPEERRRVDRDFTVDFSNVI